MIRIRFLRFALALLAACTLGMDSFSASPHAATNDRRSLQNVPIWFENNRGQAESQFEFISRGPGYSLLMAATELFVGIQDPAQQRQGMIRLQFVGANPNAKLAGRERLPATVRYYRGNRPDSWITDVSAFSRVETENLYDGIDAVFYGNQQQFEYDLVLRPNANPSSIVLDIDGTQAIVIDETGDLIMQTAAGPIVMKRPVVYQESGGRRQLVESGYVLLNDHSVGFQVAEYDKNISLVIDPVLTYSTYLGGTGSETANHLTLDGDGNVYVTGQTFSPIFVNNQRIGGGDIFVSKLNPAGSLVYSAVLGGSSTDAGNAIAVDFFQNLYIVGNTASSDFPVQNAIQATIKGLQDAFILNLARDGTLAFSTYLGGTGSESAVAVAEDSSGIYAAGETNSSDFPGTANPPSPITQDAYVIKINRATQPAIVFSRTLGGSGSDSVADMAVDAAGSVYITGATDSSDFPRLLALQSRLGGATDAFLMRFSSTGVPVFSTYLGGINGDRGTAITVDSTGIYVAGQTTSTDFPLQRGAQETFGGIEDGFVTKINLIGSAILWSTFLGGSGFDAATALAVDGSGNLLVTGFTESTNFPLINPLQDRNLGGLDAILSRYTTTGQMIFSSYFGGQLDDVANAIASNVLGNVYIAGTTRSADFPTAQAIQRVRAGESDAFITQIPEASLHPANDDFVNAIQIFGSSGSTTGNNFGATQEAKEPAPPRIGRTSVWWRWTAPFTGPIVFDTIGSPFDTMLGVYRGSELSVLVPIASDDDGGGSGTSRIQFPTIEGVEYHIVVTGFSSAMGTIKLNWSLTLPPFTSQVGFRGLPPPIRPGVPGVIPPAQQQSVGVSLGTPYPVLITGQLQLLFAPDTGLVDDPAIQFSTGGRVVNFRIAPNTTDAVFDDLTTNILFQTGTVAGTITTRVVLSALGQDITPVNAPQGSATVSQLPPVIADIRLNPTGETGFEIIVLGYSTTRHMKQALFEFKASVGSSLGTTSLTVDMESIFNTWFRSAQSNQFGGQFRLAVPFTISGGTNTTYDSIFVTLTNTPGNSTRTEVGKP